MHFLYTVEITPEADEDYVLGFDLESEEWNDRIKGPRSGEELEDCKCLVGLNDALCLIQWTITEF
jgi:hypothetical protein